LIALDKYGCSDTETVIINTAFEDQFEIKTDSVSCPEKSDGTIIINALTLQNAPYNFRLNDSINNYSGIFAHLSSGVYQITITNKHGCDTIITTEIIEPIAAYIYIVPDSITITLGQQIQYDVIFGPYLPSSVISYEWQPKEALSCSDCPNPIPLNFGLINHYRLKVTYNDDCVAEAKAVIYVDAEHKVFIPNIFSPNGDGRNDYFEIYGNKEGWKEMEFYIFDRWGELVFETADKNFKWDGIFRGQELNPAVFVYKTRIVFLDGLYRDFNGSITLTR
jgi:gliding motility-associated-like protein